MRGTRLVLLALCVAVLGGCAGAASSGPASPTSSPIPTATASLAPAPTIAPIPTPTPSPTPDTRPWAERIPPSPYATIDAVPIAKDTFGNAGTSVLRMIPAGDPPDNFFFEGVTMTIVAVEPDTVHLLIPYSQRTTTCSVGRGGRQATPTVVILGNGSRARKKRGTLCRTPKQADAQRGSTEEGKGPTDGMALDINDPTTWPDATIVVRGGVNKLEELQAAVQVGGGISVVSRPNLSFATLAASVRNNQVRRTTVRSVLAAGGTLVPTFEPDEPPNHCNLFGLTAEALDSILGPAEPNPVPIDRRWRGPKR